MPADLEHPAVVMVPVLLSTDRAADLLGCSPRTIRRLVAAGHLPAVRHNGRIMVRGDELARYIDALERLGHQPHRPTTPRRPSRRTYGYLRQ